MSIIVGVDLGATKIQTIATTRDANIVGRHRMASPATGGPAAIVAAICMSVRDTLRAAGADLGDLQAIGIGAPGQVDTTTGVVLQAVNLAGWDRPVPLAALARANLDVPIIPSTMSRRALSASIARVLVVARPRCWAFSVARVLVVG